MIEPRIREFVPEWCTRQLISSRSLTDLVVIIMKVWNAHRGIVALLAGAALIVTQVLSGGVVVAAQNAGAGCDLAPLELPLFGGTPVAVFATPPADSSPTSVGGVDQAEVQAALEQYVACMNTGDPTLVWAIFTPRWFAQTFADPEEHYLPAFEQMLDDQVSPPENPIELMSVEDITQRDDGRVDVVATFESAGQQWTDMLTLAQVDGRWLIDDVRLIEPTG